MKMLKLAKKYMIFLIALSALIGLSLWNINMGVKAVYTIKNSVKEMIFILPPVFILLGLLDVWVPRETMVKFMGEDSGLKGALLAFILGSAAAGPLYVVFPVAASFMKKGVKFFNILVLVGAWSTTKFPMLMFEYTSMGAPFFLTRLSMNIPIIVFIALIINKFLGKEEIDGIYEKAEELG